MKKARDLLRQRLFFSFRFSFPHFSTDFQKFTKIRIDIKFYIQIEDLCLTPRVEPEQSTPRDEVCIF